MKIFISLITKHKNREAMDQQIFEDNINLSNWYPYSMLFLLSWATLWYHTG